MADTNDQDVVLDSSVGTAGVDLSDVTLSIDVTSMSDICTSWNQRVAQVDLNSIKINQVYLPLTTCGIASSYIPSLEKALDDITVLVNSTSNIIINAVEEQVLVDDNGLKNDVGIPGDSSEETVDENTRGNGSSESDSSGSSGTGGSDSSSSGSSGSSGSGYSGSSSSGSSGNTGGSGSGGGSSVGNNSSLNLQINTTLMNNINSLDFNSYNKFMESLSSLVTSEISLTTYLTSSSYSDIVKTTLVNSNSTPDNIKKIITEMDSRVLQATLYSLIKDTTSVDVVSKNIMYTYAETLAKNSNMSVSEMLKNQNSVVKIFTDFGKFSKTVDNLLSSDDLTNKLTNIYDGNSVSNLDQNNISFIRNVVDKIAAGKNISSESLIADSANNKVLKDSFEEIGKSFKYVTNVGYTDLNTATSVLNSLFS